MRVWIYTRLSKDDDPEQDSLQNQARICREFADGRGDLVVGQSSDDNISGMQFSRHGLDALTAAVDTNKIDAVLVKDLSRLGRHRTQTALFIDYLRECGVRVISVTEGLDTTQEEDDLVIGIRGLMNDYYAKDIGKKIRTGYRQKQREGIVITPPFGYRKDRNTNEIVVNPEAAETVKLIYSLYLQGCGQKKIARRLNALGRKTRATHKTQDGRYLWTYASVKNVLTEEAYTGVLINHRSETSGGKAKRLEQSEWIRHEHFFQVIVEQSIWAQVQQRLKEQARTANGNQAKHRYAGLLRCRECGNPFVPMIRYWNGKRRVEYVCKGYHRSGKSCCSSHRIHEETLDAEVQKHLMAVRDVHVRERQQILEQQKQWALRKPVLDAHCFALQKRVANLECELDALIIEHLKAGRPSN